MERCTARRILVFAALLLLGMVLPADPARSAAGRALPILSDRLPSQPVSCSLPGGELRPDEALRGKPALLLFMDLRAGAATDLQRSLAGLQEEYAPWLTWGAVLAGPADPAGIRRLREESPLRFDRLWHDLDGSWRASFNVTDLPTAVLVTEEGYVARRQTGFRPDDGPELRIALERLVKAGKVKGRPVRDFKLLEAGTGKLTTLADVAPRDFTVLFSLRSDCAGCYAELKTLQLVRDLHPGRLALVAIFHDPEVEPQAATATGQEGVRPDLILRDPQMSYADRCSIEGVPSLVVVDPAGKVVMARQGFLPDEVPALTAELELLIGRRPPPEEETGFAEFRRIRAEALELLGEGRAGLAAIFLERALELYPDFYTVEALLAEAYLAAGRPREAVSAYDRYLAAEPRAYDREKIEEQIKVLAAAP